MTARFAICLSLLAFAPDVSSAQHATPSFHVSQPEPKRTHPAGRFIGRAVAGYAAGIPAGIVVGAIGAKVERSSGYFCDCDDPGLTGFVIGFAAGNLIAGTLASASPSFNGPCTYTQRLKTALVSTSIPLAASAFISLASGNGAPVLVTPILVTPIASAIGLHSRC